MMKYLTPKQGVISSFATRISLLRGTWKNSSMTPCRLQSTSTMDLVSMDEAWSCAPPSPIWSTLQIKTGRDVSASPAAVSVVSSAAGQASFSSESTSPNLPVQKEIESQELDLVQAAKCRHMYDKIFLMVHQGEDETQISGILHEDSIDALTGRGVGQALSLSRRTAEFCCESLRPELVLVAPIRSVLQTCFLSFPYDTPHQSFNRTKWICYPTANRSTASLYPSIVDLQREFPGIDLSLCCDEDALMESSDERLEKETSGMLDWLKTRHEKVVVGKLDCTV